MERDALQRLYNIVVITKEEELNCGQFYEMMDVFADMCMKGEDASEFYPLVDHHIQLCASCREEYEGFLDCLQANEEH